MRSVSSHLAPGALAPDRVVGCLWFAPDRSAEIDRNRTRASRPAGTSPPLLMIGDSGGSDGGRSSGYRLITTYATRHIGFRCGDAPSRHIEG